MFRSSLFKLSPKLNVSLTRLANPRIPSSVCLSTKFFSTSHPTLITLRRSYTEEQLATSRKIKQSYRRQMAFKTLMTLLGVGVVLFAESKRQKVQARQQIPSWHGFSIKIVLRLPFLR